MLCKESIPCALQPIASVEMDSPRPEHVHIQARFLTNPSPDRAMDSFDFSAVVEIKGDSVDVHFSHEDTEPIEVPRAVLDKSALLRQIVDDYDGAERIHLSVPANFLHSWLQWRTNESSWDSKFLTFAPRILQFLQVCL